MRAHRPIFTLICAFALSTFTSIGCTRSHPDPNTIVMLIESSPANLDPRIGTDAFSERIDELLFDSLVRKDEHFVLHPWVAQSWDIPNPLTYIFHLRHGVRFHDGRPVTAKDVKWSIDSMMNGTVISSNSATHQHVATIDARDCYSLVLHMKEPDSGLLGNLSAGALGSDPSGGDSRVNLH